jgi:hypothetical protein
MSSRNHQVMLSPRVDAAEKCRAFQCASFVASAKLDGLATAIGLSFVEGHALLARNGITVDYIKQIRELVVQRQRQQDPHVYEYFPFEIE